MSDALLQRIQKQAAEWARTGARFVEDSTLEKISSMSEADINEFDFGAVKLDDDGNIQLFNKKESERSGVPMQEATGKNFFSQVAPCTNNAIFLGSFKKGVTEGAMDYIFPYTFTYKMKPTPVKVHLFRKEGSKENWLFVKWP